MGKVPDQIVDAGCVSVSQPCRPSWVFRAMSASARPGIVFSSLDNAGANGIQFHVPDSVQVVRLIQNAGEIPAVPEMALFLILLIEKCRVLAVRRADRFSERFSVFWNSNQMHVIRHEAIGTKVQAASFGVFAEKPEIEFVVLVIQKDLFAVITAMGNVVWHFRDYHSWLFGHAVSEWARGAVIFRRTDLSG